MDGIILIDKPKGWTSFDVVAKVRSTLRAEARKSLETGDQRPDKDQHTKLLISNLQPLISKPKVGHTGTLDPLATGLLIIVTGSYCKRAQEFSKLDKVYEAELTLGYTSTTDDNEGEKTKISGKKPSLQELERVLNTFVGEQLQLPPAFSAIKVNGKRAYKLAREGKAVALEPRQVTIYKLQVTSYDYPKVTFTVKVSSGTYIRSLARDIGQKLGTGAYLSNLRRTEVGKYQIGSAVEVDKFQPQHIFQP